MQIFQVRELRINAITIIADDIHHASHICLLALHDGLRHWPGVSYAIGPWTPPDNMAPEILKKFAEQNAGGFAQFIENGWEVTRTDPLRAAFD